MNTATIKDAKKIIRPPSQQKTVIVKSPLCSQGLELVQEFIKHCKAGDKQAQNNLDSVREMLQTNTQRPDFWRRLLLIVMSSNFADLKDKVIREYINLIQQDEANRSINDLLSFCMDDYHDFEHIRSILIDILYTELKTRSDLWTGETIKFMLNMKRIFEVSYSEQFTSGAVNCLFSVLDNKENHSSRILSNTVLDWFRTSLREGTSPSVTERAIKKGLSRRSFNSVKIEFIESIYDRLDVESNPEKLLDTFATLKKWYKNFHYENTDNHISLKNELEEIGRGRLEFNSTVRDTTKRILNANYRVLQRILEIIDFWSGNKTICESAFQLLLLLPAARRVLTEKHTNWRLSVLLRFADESREYLFNGALDFFATFVSGMTRNIEEKYEEAGEANGRKYHQRLTLVNKWAQLDYDVRIIDTLNKLMSDSELELSRRKSALHCLTRINPHNLYSLFNEFSLSHPTNDPLVPHILDVIIKLKAWDCWSFCNRYFVVYDLDNRCPFLDQLMQAAIATGNALMIDIFVSYAFDFPDKTIRNQAREGLEKVGYGNFYHREKINRAIRKLYPEHTKAFNKYQTAFQESNSKQSKRFNTQINLQKTRMVIEKEYLDLKMQVTSFQTFSTGKFIVLSIIDKKLKELTEKIDHLTQRKNELEIQKDILIRKRDDLTAEWESCAKEIERKQKKTRDIQKRLEKLQSERHQLKNQLSRLTADLHQAENNAQQVKHQQQNLISRLKSEYNELEHQIREYQHRIEVMGNSYYSTQSEVSSISMQIGNMTDDINYLHREIDYRASDDPGLSSLQQEIRQKEHSRRNLQSDLQRLNSQLNKIQLDINNLKSQENQAENRRTEILRNLRSAEEAIDSAEQKVELAYNNETNCQQRIAENRSNTQYEEQNLASTNSEIQSLQIHNNELQNRIVELKNREQELVAELLPVIHDLNQAKKEYEKINRQKESEEQIINKENRKAEILRDTITNSLRESNTQWQGLSGEITGLQNELYELFKTIEYWDGKVSDLSQQIEDNKRTYQRMDEKCQQALLAIDREAQTKQLLARLNFDLDQMNKLEYCRWMCKAIDRFGAFQTSGETL